MKTEEILNLIESVSIILASISAFYGINSWIKEAKWKRRHELSEDVLYNLYDARDKLHLIRHPFAFPSEGQSRPPLPNEKEGEKSIRDYAYVTVERYNNNNEPFLNLEKLRLRHKIYFGEETAKPIQEVISIKNEIISASYKYGRLSIERDRLLDMRLEETDNAKQINSLNSQINIFGGIIWEDYDEEDSIKKGIDESIGKMERNLKKYLR